MDYYHFNLELVPTRLQTFAQSLLDCHSFEKSDRLLGFSKGRGVTWFLHTQAEFGVDSVLRHYYRGGFFGRLVKESYLFKGIENTRAAQEFKLLNKMYQWGLPVPRAIAFKISHAFGIYQADILLEKIANTQDLSQFLQNQRLTEKEYREIGQLIRQLHNVQIHHSDLNIHNILRQKQSGKFFLIDFDKCKIQQGEHWKKDNLTRLLRSFQKEKQRLGILFELQDWHILMQGYQE